MRPTQRDSSIPDGQAGIRLAVNGWKAIQTSGGTGTAANPLSIAVTGHLMHVAVPQVTTTAAPLGNNTGDAGSIAIDAFIPIIPATAAKQENSLALLAEFTTGFGNALLYTSATGGLANNGLVALPPNALGVAQTFQGDIDPGVLTLDANGGIHFINWSTIRGGLEYHLPFADGKLWLSGNYAHVWSTNSTDWVAKTSSVRKWLDWWDVNVFGDLTPAIRLGVEYAQYRDLYGDGVSAIDRHLVGAAWFIF
jgi:hypothetical protein